jgi:GntR family transcriptional regulator of arabinose operon
MYIKNMSGERIESASKPQLLRSALLESLQRGILKVGDRLPSEPELISRYGVSRGTVREALISLEQEGWVRRLQGKGTFVNERPKVHKTVAVIAPYLYATDTPDFRAGTDVIPILMQSIEHHARKQGINIMLYLDNLEPETERENILNVLDRGVDAILMIYIGGDQNLDCLTKIQDAGIPLVLFDRYIEELAIDSVASDNYLGAFRAVERFLESGFPSVTYITCPVDSTVLRDRCEGYREAMKKNGLTPHVLELVQEVGEGIDRVNYDRSSAIVDRLDFPTAIFSSDATRLALISQLVQERGVPVSDYALGCFDEPYLTFSEELLFVKVLQPLREIGRKAVDLTLHLLEMKATSSEKKKRSRLLLPPEILSLGPPTRPGHHGISRSA